MNMLSRGQLREIIPEHWLDDQEGWTCSKCNQSFSQDEESFAHPNPKYVTLRWCVQCRSEPNQ